MNITFIIPLFNEEKTILICLEALKEQMEAGDEIIVVDNGSTDGSVAAISGLPHIKIIERPGKTIAAVRNAGATIATGEVLAFIDADCVICPGWRQNVVKTFAGTGVGASGSKVEVPDDAVWIEKAWYSQKISSYRRVSYINSGNLVIRREIFEQAGGFREDLATGEDSELGWRVNMAGHPVIDNPAIRAVHLGNPKTLIEFYRKEKWHALGMMGTFRLFLLDKPLIMTASFAVCNFFAAILFIYFLAKGSMVPALACPVVLIGGVPVVTSLYRVAQFGNTRYFLDLVLLYWIYYLARANVLMFLCCSNRWRQRGAT
jgi:glycosyltransferase involved in cell wall biosynthesis